MVYNQYDLQNTSLVKTGILTEMYIPLFYYSSSYAQMVGSSSPIGTYFFAKGSASYVSTNTDSQIKLHTLSPNWSSSQKFAFEASFFVSQTVNTVSLALYDLTTNTLVSASQISTSSTTATVYRSGQFTLTPGHTYGITIGTVAGTYVNMTKASLIAFLS